MRKDKSAKLLEWLREGQELSMRQQLLLIVHLSIPAIFAQISSIIMEYIDARRQTDYEAGTDNSLIV